MKKLMLDLETLGTTPGCVVLSIGAVEFDENDLHGSFHAHIDLESSCKAGLVIEPRTTMWWLEQSSEAQSALLEAEKFELRETLEAFVDTFDWDGLQVWANGASFDFPILTAAFNAAGIKTPWAYYNECDYRTLKNLVNKQVFNNLRVRPDLAHDALSDAIAQARTTQNILKWLRGEYDAKRVAA